MAEHRYVTEIDRKLLSLALIPRAYRSPITRARMDQLLDERNEIRAPRPVARLRPSVPVIPGRSS